MATPPSRPSPTTVVHRGCLKQDNKTKPSPIQPWHFLLRIFWRCQGRDNPVMGKGWGKHAALAPRLVPCHLWWHHTSCPRMGPISEMGCSVPLELPGGTARVTVPWKQGTKVGHNSSTLLRQGEVFGLPSPLQGLGVGKPRALPALLQPGRPIPVFCSPFHKEHVHGLITTAAGDQPSSHQFGGLQLSWPPPASLGAGWSSQLISHR